MLQKIYPRSKDKETVYLKSVITNPNIIVGDYTMYNDFVKEPKDFEKNNVLYQYPINQDKLIIGKFCSIACGAKFIFNSANHTLSSYYNNYWLEVQHPAGLLSVSCLSYNKGSNWLTNTSLGLDVR